MNELQATQLFLLVAMIICIVDLWKKLMIKRAKRKAWEKYLHKIHDGNIRK